MENQETNTNQAPQENQGQGDVQSKTTMAVVAFFSGGLGIHRLMMGYKNWWLMIITLGGLGIWTLIDFIRILIGDMKMADGRPLK
jgi:TM2 domain-containing membrane protein YozV